MTVMGDPQASWRLLPIVQARNKHAGTDNTDIPIGQLLSYRMSLPLSLLPSRREICVKEVSVAKRDVIFPCILIFLFSIV